MTTLNSSDAGFTGLEAAIVLIAFVIVAAIFGFIVLQAGFTSTQRSQSVIQDGIKQAGSSCMVTGTVYGISIEPKHVGSFIVPVGLTAGGESIDITTVSIRFVGQNHREIIPQNTPLVDAFSQAGSWSVQQRVNSNADHLLDPGEQFFLNISPNILSDCKPGMSFTIEIKPAGRAALRVERTIPGSIEKVNRLD